MRWQGRVCRDDMSDGTCRRFPNLSFTAVRAKLCQNSTGITPTPTQIKREQGKHFLVCMTLAGAGTGLQSLVGLSGPVVRFHLAHVTQNIGRRDFVMLECKLHC